MSQFLGTHQNKLDGKGRVSIPALFRGALKAMEGGGTLILRPSPEHTCIEAWPVNAFNALESKLAELDPLDEQHEVEAFNLYADAWPIEADKDGRVLLPEALIAHAGLADTVEFVGMGNKFYIWEPEAASVFRNFARDARRAQKAAKRDAEKTAA